MIFEVKKGDFSRLGARGTGKGVNFCFTAARGAECTILLYDSTSMEIIEKIPAPKEFCVGNVRAVSVENLSMKNYDYNYEIDGCIVNDPYARNFIGRKNFGDTDRKKDFIGRCRLVLEEFQWTNDRLPRIPRKDMVVYKLHARGFTMASGMRPELRGTFAGITKKIPYLKSLGITTIEMMPVYEFEELQTKEEVKLPEYVKWKQKKTDKIQKDMLPKQQEKINFWGYCKGSYFAPKTSYSSSANAPNELKECIQSLHKNGMECILEMYFAEGENPNFILSVLRFWAEEYHVDGYHLQGTGIPMELILKDAYLEGLKLFYTGFPFVDSSNGASEQRLFVDTDEFIYPCRKLAAGISNNLEEFLNQMKKQNEHVGYINYIADNNGFTLADLFMYSRKHNEANGEDNTDGPEWNCSTNCGVEGPTNGRNVRKIRVRKMKNAAALLFLSQAVPMLMSGDESGNTQQGNNNAYCQDNEIGWKDWKKGKSVEEFIEYIQQLSQFRAAHPVLRQEAPMRMMDYKTCGCPDLSYHGENAWISPQVGTRSAVGILYCGEYLDKGVDDVYIGMNFSECEEELALPKFANSRKWFLVMSTDRKDSFLQEPEELMQRKVLVPAQSIRIIIGKSDSWSESENESMAAFENDSAS